MAHILIVDDDTVLLKLYSTRLLADNHQVETATNGELGLQAMQKKIPDIIILDLLMPKVNGFRFLEMIKKTPEWQNVPIIVFSSVANKEQIDRLKQLGVTTYLNKIEVTPTQLVAEIQKLLTPPVATPMS